MQHAKKFVLVDPEAYSRQIKMPSVHTIAEPSSVSLDDEVRSILDSFEPDDVKVKRYVMTLKKFRDRSAPPTTSTSSVRDSIGEEDILESVPPTTRYKAKRLLHAIRQIPDLKWNERGELVYKQSIVPHSNIVELFNDILKAKQPTRAVGWEQFADGLASSNELNKDLVPNHASWKRIKEQRSTKQVIRSNRRETRREEKTSRRKRRRGVRSQKCKCIVRRSLKSLTTR